MFGSRPAFSGGIALPRRERPPGELAIRQMPFAPLLYLPLGPHPDGPVVPVVREGEEVVRGQLLAAATDEAGVPLHAPATGRVLGISEQPEPGGGTVGVMHLAPFPGDTQEYPHGAGCDAESASVAGLISAIRAAGLVELGGEGRAVHARLATGQQAATLVLNGIESEPAFSTAAAILRAHAADVHMGLRCLLKAGGATRAVLAVEPQDSGAAHALLAAAADSLSLTARILTPRYPQGAEELLLRALALAPARRGGRHVAEGALCFNLATVAELGRLLASGRCLTDQVVTLTGGALHEPGNYRVPLGTPLRFALQFAGLQSSPVQLLAGGPMRGQPLASLEQPVTRGTTGYVAMDREEACPPEPPLPCIRCGECIAVCPVQLHPAELGLLARKDELQIMHEEYHLDSCIECGCCAYVCPSRIPLLQTFRAAKAQWRRLQPANAGKDAA